MRAPRRCEVALRGAEANEHGEQLTETLGKDELHLGLVTDLELPEGYVASKIAKRPDAGRGFQSGTQKMVTPFAGKDKALKAVLQLHSDEGMNAARKMLDAKSNGPTFFSANPAIKERYDSDAAFHAGFDGLRWAKDHGAYDATVKSLQSRDARYDANHIGCRG